jgi:hypothetical protein
MIDRDLVCAILRVLVTTHAYGRPLPDDVVLSRAAYPSHRGGAAKAAIDHVRSLPFVVDRADRGIRLDPSRFEGVVRYLHTRCGWDRYELEVRIKHFEGWDLIEWEE